jgi:membrane carboxypeptidase/penicillin-binding protein
VEGTLQEGLSRYERSAGRVEFQGGEANLAQAVETIEKSTTSMDHRPAWQRAVSAARLPLYDVHWTPAVVIEIPKGKRADVFNVGLADGRTMPMSVEDAAARRKLKLYDMVLVKVNAGTGKAARAEIRVRPIVQGAVIVLENKTGKILAMTGGFSYPLSQLNRATQAVRQPGSAIKPLSYLAALGKGLQPNTLIKDEAISLPPVGGAQLRGEDFWTPKNYDGNAGGLVTMRSALERSRNLATVRLLDGGIESKPEASLDRVCELAIEARIYRECARYYPFVLGAQPVRPVDLAAFYATIANEGRRPVRSRMLSNP